MNQNQPFYLLIDTKFIYCYLATKWIKNFASYPGFQGILAREDRPTDELIEKRDKFHKRYVGETGLTPSMKADLSQMYRDFGSESQTSIRLFGVPLHSISEYPDVIYLGKDLNSPEAQEWVKENIANRNIWIFSRVGQLLKPWWIEYSNGQLLNLHTAVLPYARGVHAIQRVVAAGNEKQLLQAAGATIHYVDPGVDTGGIVRAERFRDPLRCRDLWELVAHLYELGHDLYVRTAREILDHPDSRPAGILTDPALKGPAYLRKNFTPEIRAQAEQAYLRMREDWVNRMGINDR